MLDLSKRICSVVLSVTLVTLSATPGLAQDRLTTAQARAIKKIESGMDRAGRLFENNKQKQSAAIVNQLAEDLQKLLKKDPSAALLAAVQPQHARLQQARNALVAAGQSVPSIPDLPEATIDPNAPVSFAREIATILNTNCGSCHVQRNRGQFSMATYTSLAAGAGGAPVIVPGKPDESRMIEAIEEGSMPPNGQVPAAQLARLKKWITDGAPFDGDDPNAQVATMVRPTQRRNIEIVRPVGNETVSFSRDIAPVLISNCMGCHFEAQNVRGGLRIDNFQQLLRGGDSGPMIRAGDGENSLLVQRLTATDNTRMPRGRRPLDKAVIDKIVTWIDEGARFDGREGPMNLREVTEIAASEAATHEELTENRRKDVLRNWKKVMSDVEPVFADGDEVLVVGTSNNQMLQDISDVGDSVSQKIKSKFQLDDNQPLVKGQISIFVFDRRYDYSEFGKMVETRDIPKTWRSHWGYDTVNAYVAMLTSNSTLKEMKPELTQRLASVAAASLGGDVPEWFADGLGYVVAEQLVADKAVVKNWQAQSTAAVSEMTDPTDFMQGRLANDKSGLVAYAFVKSLKENDAKEFRKFLQTLQDGTVFDEAFAASWSAPPIELMRRQFGNPGRRNNRQRRNRRGR